MSQITSTITNVYRVEHEPDGGYYVTYDRADDTSPFVWLPANAAPEIGCRLTLTTDHHGLCRFIALDGEIVRDHR